MRHTTIFKSLMFLAFALVPVAAVTAQEPMDGPPPGVNRPMDFRTNALRQLGLTRDQLQRIKGLNQERKPRMDAAQMRLRQAKQKLDESIYSDNATEADFQASLKDFQAAQGEIAKLNFTHEFGVRRILTPEQLTHFRQMRRRFEESRMLNERNGAQPGTPPLNKPRPGPAFVKQNNRNRQF